MTTIGTQKYSELLKQLRMVAINSKDLTKRQRMRDNMLRLVARAFDVSSAYICQHDFETKLSTVRHDFIGSRAKDSECDSDLGCHFHEDEMGNFVDWLHGAYHVPRVIHLKDLPAGSPERREYEQYGTQTIAFFALSYQDKLWGYIEIWDSRRNRQFTDSELLTLVDMVQAISDTLLSADG